MHLFNSRFGRSIGPQGSVMGQGQVTVQLEGAAHDCGKQCGTYSHSLKKMDGTDGKKREV